MNRKEIHIPASLGEKIADGVVKGMGSWKFIIIQTFIVFGWILGNLYVFTHPFDPFPFILLNLLFSTQAAYASPLILMASNRSDAKAQVRDDLEAVEVQRMYDNHDLLLEIIQQLLKINQQQLEILEALKEKK